MNHTSRCITGLSLLLAAFCQASLAQTLNVVHSGKWPPYADAGLPAQGLAVELVTTALKRAGYTPVVNREWCLINTNVHPSTEQNEPVVSVY